MIIYHGSKSDFEKFDMSKIKTNAISEGVGFYCTDNKEIAERYGSEGYLLEFDYCGKKTLSGEKLTLTREEITEYILSINNRTDLLSNYGDIDYDGYREVLKRAVDSFYEYSQDDVGLITEICNTCGGFKIPLEELYFTLGYDSAIVEADWGDQNIYLIFTNEAIKYIKSTKL